VGADTLPWERAAGDGGDWVGPYWYECQPDRSSPPGRVPAQLNLTARNWTAVGNVASSLAAIVDPRGLVTPWPGGWSLDWWIGAEDRWHFPSRESSVRQRLVGTSPVVESAMRVPGGDAVERVYAVAGPGGLGDLVVVEIENRSAVPFVVALAVRPFNPDGPAAIEQLGLHDRRLLTVDGQPALWLARPPGSVAASTLDGGDVAAAVASGRTQPDLDSVRCASGMAQAAVLFPLAHTAVLRVAIPTASEGATGRRGRVTRRVARYSSGFPTLASAASVARGWDVQARRGARFVLPEGRLADAVEANRKALLLLHSGGEITSTAQGRGGFRLRDAVDLLGALDRYGFAAEVAEVLATFPGRQRTDGWFAGEHREINANGCAIVAMADHWRLTRDEELRSALHASVILGARWLQRHDGLPPRRSEQLARRSKPVGHVDEDGWWSAAGLGNGAELLSAGGGADGADRLHWATARLADAREALAGTALADAALVGSLVAVCPLGLLEPDDPSMLAAVDLIRQRCCVGDGFGGPGGLSPLRTLQLAAVELAQADRRALDRLRWVLDVAAPTFAWPEVIDPVSHRGCRGEGQDGLAGAAFLRLVRNLLVMEVGVQPAADESPVGLALCAMLPPEWDGHAIEVHDAPTEVGRLSFAVRWHGPRPALLWELTPHPGVGRVVITAPGLDLSWSSSEPQGEALLAGLQVTGGPDGIGPGLRT
jgi:hypothetical protein